MGQVPGVGKGLSYAIVGDGAVARHFAHYLSLKNIGFKSWSRRSSASMSDALREADIVLILIKDDAIESFVDAHLNELADKILIHFSGSLVSSRTVGMHPLMTFSGSPYSLSTYESIPFICEQGRPLFRDVFPRLPNPCFTIDPRMKPLYHSLCVMSGNFSVLLWQKLFTEFENKLGLPHEAVLPYLRQTLLNLESHPNMSLTGPLQRQDRETIAKNLAALDGDLYQIVYKAFLEAHS